MWPFKSRRHYRNKKEKNLEKDQETLFDISILRKNNISRLTLDERWTRLFAALPMSPELQVLQKSMNELIKEEAMLKKEQETLEPEKKRFMNRIMSLTKRAFEEDDDKAKEELKKDKQQIEKINERMEHIEDDVVRVEEDLKQSNFILLQETVRYIFSAIAGHRAKTIQLKTELDELVKREEAIRKEIESYRVDWSQYAANFTTLIGTDELKKLESLYGLEGIPNEADNTGTDASNR